jgi:hypothetical protein
MAAASAPDIPLLDGIGAALIVAGIAFVFLIRRLPRASTRRPRPFAR